MIGTYGTNLDFLNYHLSDRRLRLLYQPPAEKDGRVAVFNVTSSRLSQYPYESNGAPRFGWPIGARTASVEIHVTPHNERPSPAMPAATHRVSEDYITVMKLRLTDLDTPSGQIRAYVTTFPQNGVLYQVRTCWSAPPVLNVCLQGRNVWIETLLSMDVRCVLIVHNAF